MKIVATGETGNAELAAPNRPLFAYLGTLSPNGSRQVIAGALRRVARLLEVDYETYPWHTLSGDEHEKIRKLLTADGAGGSTVAAALSAVRGSVRVSHGVDSYTLNWAEPHVPDGNQEVYGYERKRRSSSDTRALTRKEFVALLNVCLWDETTVGARDAAAIIVLYVTGLALDKATALKLEDWTPRPASLMASEPAKRGESPIMLGNTAAQIMANWVAARGSHPGRLLLPLDRRGCVKGERLPSGTARYMLATRAKQASIVPVSSQDLRHTALRDLRAAGASYWTLDRMSRLRLNYDLFWKYGGTVGPKPLEYPGQGYPAETPHGATPFHKW